MRKTLNPVDHAAIQKEYEAEERREKARLARCNQKFVKLMRQNYGEPMYHPSPDELCGVYVHELGQVVWRVRSRTRPYRFSEHESVEVARWVFDRDCREVARTNPDAVKNPKGIPRYTKEHEDYLRWQLALIESRTPEDLAWARSI